MKRKYYRPPEGTDIYKHAGNSIMECVTKPEKTIKVEADDKLPCSRKAPTFHDPVTTKINSVEDLREMYPNRFDRLGSLEGEHEIKLDPSVPPKQNGRRRVPIEVKEEIEKAFERLKENMKLNWIPQYHPSRMAEGRCQLKSKRRSRRPLNTWRRWT